MCKAINWITGLGLSFVGMVCASFANDTVSVDYLIEHGLVFDGTGTPGEQLSIGIKDERIVFVGHDTRAVQADITIDAAGHIVSPGFIDVHTHAYNEKPDTGPIRLDSYITQGITTVVSGNDGQGPANFEQVADQISRQVLNANMALFVGHGSVRRSVMGMEDRAPTATEFSDMKKLVAAAMKNGALGLSTGLFYAPGSFAETEEVVELAKVVAASGGIYESHIRDESNYNIGLVAAIDEAIKIGAEANIPVHIAHIKALGVDVWGYSKQVIDRIEQARSAGQKVTADQYPWLASGTRVSSSLVPRWAMGGGREQMKARLADNNLLPKIKADMRENMRRRGGAGSLLLTSGKTEWRGQTLEEYSKVMGLSPIDTAIHIIQNGDAGVASFNMSPKDLENFMMQPWVMSSSDGGSGHPRKFASFPKKYSDYVVQKKLLSVAEFIRKSTSLPADTLGLTARGKIEVGAIADLLIFDPQTFQPQATFEEPDKLSTGVIHLFVNGYPVIKHGGLTDATPGKLIGPDRNP